METNKKTTAILATRARHWALVEARNAANAAIEALGDDVDFASTEYQTARAVCEQARAALQAFDVAQNGPSAPRVRTPQIP